MKYYIPELKNIDINELSNPVIYRQKRILAKDGIYKIIKGDIYQFKLIDNGIQVLNNFMNNYTLIQSKHFWKKFRKVNHIPYHGKIQNIEYFKYGNTSTLFVIEKIDNKNVDFYFESKEEFDSILLKKDISSFLLNLM